MVYDFRAIDVGQAEVEKNQIRPNRLNSPQSLFFVANLINGVPCRGQGLAQGQVDRFFGVQNKYSWTYRAGFEIVVFHPLNCDARHYDTSG